MRRIFVSYKFRDPDRAFAGHIKDLIQSHGIEVDTGEDLGGEPLWPEIRKGIEASDGLVVLFTSPDDPQHYRFVFREMDHASSLKKRVFALVDTTFPWNDPENREHGKFDPNSPLPGFLKLSRTIGRWRRDAGRSITVHLLPENVARLAGRDNAPYRCRYRLYERKVPLGDWQEARLAKENGRYEFEAVGLRDRCGIQVEIYGSGKTPYVSEITSERIAVNLEQDQDVT